MENEKAARDLAGPKYVSIYGGWYILARESAGIKKNDEVKVITSSGKEKVVKIEEAIGNITLKIEGADTQCVIYSYEQLKK